jgi:hypothetical protein
MNQALCDARADLEAAGLQVTPSGEGSLWIAATTKDVADGIRLSNDAAALIRKGNGWVAVFPAEGMLNYEVPGGLPDLLSLIRGVYTRYRHLGGQLNDAFRWTVPNADFYLVGRFAREGTALHAVTSGQEEAVPSRGGPDTPGNHHTRR